MSAPLGPAGLAALILTGWAVIGLLFAIGKLPAAVHRAEPPGAPLTAEEQAVLDDLELQFREQP